VAIFIKTRQGYKKYFPLSREPTGQELLLLNKEALIEQELIIYKVTKPQHAFFIYNPVKNK
jgi:hypothetical protein